MDRAVDSDPLEISVMHMTICMSVHMSVNMSVHMSIHISIHMSIFLSVHMSAHVTDQSIGVHSATTGLYSIKHSP